MRQVLRYEFLMQADQPIAHHAEVFGNSAISMRRKVRQPDGAWAQVPIVTGDTMRHGLREAAAYAVLDAVGMLDAPALTESALRLLFAGGMITGKGGESSTIKLDGYREMVDLMPPLALLGGCAQNRSIPGRMQVDDAVLICEETRHLWSPWIREQMAERVTDTCRAHVEEVQRVRMDPSLTPDKRALLTDGGREIEKRLGAHERASEKNDALSKDDAKSTMLPRRFETVVAGSLFSWGVTAVCLSDLDVGALNTMVGAFLSNAVVGGKRATGHGRMRAVAAQHVSLARPAVQATSSLDDAMGVRLFREHVTERAERIKAWLSAVDA